MSVAEQLQTEMKVYVPTDFPGASHMKYEIDYQLGGMNYFSGGSERRGYYLMVSAVERTEHVSADGRKWSSEQFGLFRAKKQFLNNNEIKRISKGALAEARANITDELIDNMTLVVGNGRG